jgi:hypothetical protein
MYPKHAEMNGAVLREKQVLVSCEHREAQARFLANIRSDHRHRTDILAPRIPRRVYVNIWVVICQSSRNCLAVAVLQAALFDRRSLAHFASTAQRFKATEEWHLKW